MRVLKFGGTSVGSATAIGRIPGILRGEKEKLLIVVSAFSGVTDRLARLLDRLRATDPAGAHEELTLLTRQWATLIGEVGLDAGLPDILGDIPERLASLIPALITIGEVPPRAADAILATGEIVSSRTLCALLNKVGLPTAQVDPRSIMITDDAFGVAIPDEPRIAQAISERLSTLFETHDIVVTGGYVGATPEGVTTTLGRGGSDLSAAVFAATGNATVCEIWTDVDGMMTVDPRIIPSARSVPRLTYDEAAELAYFGAKVLHPRTIQPAMRRGVPVVIKNTFRPEHPGTQILPATSERDKGGLKAIAFHRGITVLHIRSNRMLGAYGFLAAVFDVFRDHLTPVDLVTTSEVSISVTIDDTRHLAAIQESLSRLGEVSVERDCAILALIGEGMRRTAGIGARFFAQLSRINIIMVSVGASEVNLSIVIAERDLEAAVRLIHEAFFAEGGSP